MLKLDRGKQSSLEHTLALIAEREGASCPNCHEGVLFYTGEHFQLGDHLSKWKRALQVDFPESVYRDYPAEEWTFLFQCDSCDFGIFWPIYQGSADYYDAITRHSYYEETRSEFRKTLSLLKVIKPHSLLEIGPGSGRFLMQVKEYLPKVELHGVERNPNVRDSLSRIAVTYKDLACVHKSFDIVCAFQLIEHVANPSELVYACNSRLKENGLFILSTPNYDGPVRFYFDSLTETPPHHLTRWNRRSLRTLLERNGFKEVQVIGLPLCEENFAAYIQPVWYHALRFFCLEKDAKWVDFGRNIVSLLKRLKIREIPIIHHNILAIGKK